METWVDLAHFFNDEADCRTFAAAKHVDGDALVLAWVEARHRSTRGMALRTSSSTPPVATTTSSASTSSSRPQPAGGVSPMAGEVSAATLAPTVGNRMLTRNALVLAQFWPTRGGRGRP